MSLENKLRKYIDAKKKQIHKGRMVTEQLKAERLRKKQKKIESYEPGTFHYGILHKQKTLDFMRDVYEKRKKKREEKNESN